MKKSTRILLLLLFVVVLACGLSIWAGFSPALWDYTVIHNRETGDDLVFAFATALRINHPAAYDMIDPTLKPRLDEWMNSHQSNRCKSIPDITSIYTGTRAGRKVVLGCYGYDGWIDFVVDDVVINATKVIDWGKVSETWE